MNRIASNINQICRCINSTGHFYEDDIAELKARLGDVWELLKCGRRRSFDQNGIFHTWISGTGFQTVDRLTLRSVP